MVQESGEDSFGTPPTRTRADRPEERNMSPTP